VKKFNQARVNGGSNYDSLDNNCYLLTTTMEHYFNDTAWTHYEAHKPEKGGGKRRASFEVRRSHIVSHGAVAVRLIQPSQYRVMPGLWQIDLDGNAFNPPPLKDRAATSDAFDKMQRKLYRITSDGCMIPHYSWAMRGAGNIDKGYQLVLDAFYGWRPAGGGGHVDERLNSFGWSEMLQASHLCHMGPMCCNPTHVIAEPRWRNFKRNYCGSAGVCDCRQGLLPPWDSFQCLNRYRFRDIETIDTGGVTFLQSPFQIRATLNKDNLNGFFLPAAPDQVDDPWTNRFVENVHWEFIGDDEIGEIAAQDAVQAAKVTAKRVQRVNY
jgi:hypothetical protein